MPGGKKAIARNAVVVWGTLLVLGMPGYAKAQSTDVHAELRAIRDADQADRQGDLSRLTPEQKQDIMERDAKRLVRVKELLKQGKLDTADDFADAALVFQHGMTVSDYLAAHELGFVQLLKSQHSGGNMVVLSEDRFLQKIARKQRFGTQGAFAFDGSKRVLAQPVAEDGPYAVTDALRADLYLPPLALYKAHGPMMPPGSFDPLIERLKQRYDTKWLADAAAKPESKELAQMGERKVAGVAERDRVLVLYHADELRTADDYKNAAMILLLAADCTHLDSEQEADVYLLAHELAMVAAIRGHGAQAARMVALTMDRFLSRVGLSPRYDADEDDKNAVIEPASASVRKALGV